MAGVALHGERLGSCLEDGETFVLASEGIAHEQAKSMNCSIKSANPLL